MKPQQLSLVELVRSDYGTPIFGAMLPIEPRSASRPRAGLRGNKLMSYNDDEYTAWKRAAAMMLQNVAGPIAPLNRLVIASVLAVFARPERRPKPTVEGEEVPLHWHDGRCWAGAIRSDVDNIAKAVLDAAVQGGIIADDRLVVELRSRKVYAAKGEKPCVELRLYDAGPTP